MGDFKRNISFGLPESLTNIRLKKPTAYAAGKLAVEKSLKHGFMEMGVVNSFRALFQMNQNDGFDCPSCAWADPEKPSKLGEYCENGAKALADEATNSHIGADFFSNNSVEQLSLLTDYELNKLGRITEPLVLRPESTFYESIEWQDAYHIIAGELHSLSSPDEAIFYTSGRSSNEAAFLYGMFARAFGTNNLPDCSNMCHESSGVALSETLGIGKGSVKLEDLHEAEVIIVAGQNPGTNHPRMLTALEKCKNNGGHVISINPLEEAGLVKFKNPQTILGMVGGGTEITDIHLPVRINQDIPLVKLIIKKLALLDKNSGQVFDHDFIATYTEGYEPLMENIDTYDETELLEQCGIDEELINAAVSLLSKNTKIIVCWAMGLTQHKNGVANIREYVNLLLLKGALGKPGAGTCPVRGHSNVQGDRSVGIMHFVDEALNQRIEQHLGFKAPDKEGLDVVNSLKAMHEGTAKVFMALGGNFLMAASDTQYTAEALQKCNLTVQVSTKLNRSHLVTGKTALILPTFGRSEKDEKEGQLRYITVENSMGKVKKSRGLLKPASDKIRSEPEIIASLAHTFFEGKHSVDWNAMGKDYGLIRDKIDKVAKGFESTEKRVEGSTGYYLPNTVRNLDFSMLPNGKAQLTLNDLPNLQVGADEFVLMTIRSHDQFNTTIYGLDDRYRGVYNERRIVFMNPADMDNLGLDRLEAVDMTSNYDNKSRHARNFLVVPFQIPCGNLAAYFPETNVLVPHNHFADKSQTPISKSVIVKIIKRRNDQIEVLKKPSENKNVTL